MAMVARARADGAGARTSRGSTSIWPCPMGTVAGASLEGMLPWLPGRARAARRTRRGSRASSTGMASNRATTLTELPRTAGPPAFGSYRRLGGVGRAARSARRAAPTTRVSGGTFARSRSSARSRFGSPTSRRTSAAPARSAALLQALAATVLESGPVEADRGDYDHNRWTAARFGPEAMLIAPGGERAAPAAELAAELCRARRLRRRSGSARSSLLEALDPVHVRGGRAAALRRSARGRGRSRPAFASLTSR